MTRYAPCTCQPGHRCQRCAIRQRAIYLLTRVAPHTPDRFTDPVRYWDAYTSGCDARTALSLACGATVDQIDPVYGTHPPLRVDVTPSDDRDTVTAPNPQEPPCLV